MNTSGWPALGLGVAQIIFAVLMVGRERKPYMRMDLVKDLCVGGVLILAALRIFALEAL